MPIISQNIQSTIRTKFIQTLRFHQEGDKEVERFISSAIEKLDKGNCIALI